MTDLFQWNGITLLSRIHLRGVPQVVGFRDVLAQLGVERQFRYRRAPNEPGRRPWKRMLTGDCPLSQYVALKDHSGLSVICKDCVIDLANQEFYCSHGQGNVIRFVQIVLNTSDREKVRKWFTDRFGESVLAGDGAPRGYGKTFRGVVMRTGERLKCYKQVWRIAKKR